MAGKHTQRVASASADRRGRGRKPEFDPQTALRLMMRVFWEKGYDDTTYDDIVAATGVQRYGLYHAFGDKQSAFEAAIAHYVDRIEEFTAPMRRPDAGRAEIEDYFTRLLEANREAPIGCMVCNTAPTPVAASAPVAAAIERMFTLVRDSIEHAAGNAIAAGELDARLSAAQVGLQLLGVMIAATILVQSPLGWEAARRHVEAALHAICA